MERLSGCDRSQIKQNVMHRDKFTVERRNMIIPREIREKIEQRNQLDEEIADWFQENVDTDGCDIKKRLCG